ncbi:lactate dehydrogenase-like 2-hydroxyacid dehydrogenase [Humitalea rosea]|uniref:Lactate dehydrogenase-like 2-hydroxyacid dehydrogenase n=1 Tax=Humitalea rosea TaxID=990373 RepID=A0A2W7ID75_9PROT|nr:2-hydroxyacid dehydrogenase [Humitalea rosea]PZW43552.1 lactate dehydrogenase-like 2-hydroxyacid dehydrogenase [Humitalea rosea]
MRVVHHRAPLAPVVLEGLAQRFDRVAGPQEPLGQPGTVAVVTNGGLGLSAESMALLPELRVVSCFGAGHEGVDLEAARARGIWVTHAPGTNTATVADHAIGLMLAITRGFHASDREVRAGNWDQARKPRPTLNGGRLGILGFGLIGAQIARRAAAFDMAIAYHTRRARPDVPWRHVGSVLDLARESDVMVLACPGGAATRHLVNAEVLEALGPEGFLVNIARGSVVDTAALVAALQAGRIAAAALDVVDGEPVVPAALLAAPNLLLTPHVAGRSPASLLAQRQTLFASIDAALAGGRPQHVLAGPD